MSKITEIIPDDIPEWAIEAKAATMTEAESYYYDLCDKHEWAGVGECPSCKGERLADDCSFLKSHECPQCKTKGYASFPFGDDLVCPNCKAVIPTDWDDNDWWPVTEKGNG